MSAFTTAPFIILAILIIPSVAIAQPTPIQGVTRAPDRIGSTELVSKSGSDAKEDSKDSATPKLQLECSDKNPRIAIPACESLLPTLSTANFPAGTEEYEKYEDLYIEALVAMNRNRDAAVLIEKRLNAQEERTPANMIVVGELLSSLCILYENMNDSKNAISYGEKSVQILEKALGPNHHKVAIALNNLASVYNSSGQHYGRRADAVQLLLRSLQIDENALGHNHPDTGLRLSNLGKAYHDIGKLNDAELALKRAVMFGERSLPSDDPRLAMWLNNLSSVYKDQGRLVEAERLIIQALNIDEIHFGKEHENVAMRLSNLATILTDQRQSSRAIPLLRRSLAIREKLSGPNSLAIAKTLQNLGLALLDSGVAAEAEQVFRRAYEIKQKILGDQHWSVAVSLSSLAKSLMYSHKIEEASILLLRAFTVLTKSFGNSHPRIATTLRLLGENALLRGKEKLALNYHRQASDIEEVAIRASLSEPRAHQILDVGVEFEREVYAIAVRPRAARDSGWAELALQTALLRKGRALSTGILVSQALHGSLKTEEQRERFQTLQRLVWERAALLDSGKPYPKVRSEAQLLMEQAQDLEASLIREIRGTAVSRIPQPRQIVSRVKEQLHPGEVLVEIVVGLSTDYALPDWWRNRQEHYIALLFFPNGRIRSVDLGERRLIDELAAKFLATLQSDSNEVIAIAQEIYGQTFQKIRRELGTERRVLLSPEGVLQLVPWGAMHDGTAYLIDSYSIQYLSSGRDLLRGNAAPASQPALVLADPVSAIASPPILNARTEAEQIARLLKTRMWAGAQATEHLLRSSGVPWVLHLAMHGVFRTAGELIPGLTSTPGMTITNSEDSGYRSALLFAPPPTALAGYNNLLGLVSNQLEPMHRSALILASDTSVPNGSTNDGWLTAEEVRMLNFNGAQLVTLSGCETGLGAVSQGQGVFGLRRAFLLAGAETVVSSLWKVKDDTTAEIMVRYYEKLIHNGTGRVTALDETMKELRAKYVHPRYWAPFIVLGYGGPLRLP